MQKIIKTLLISVLLPNCLFAQLSGLYVNTEYNGLCSTSIKLNIDSTYQYETGCESSLHTTFGTWTHLNDTIKFKQIDVSDFKILKIVPAKDVNANFLSVKIFDQTGKNITEKIEVGNYVAGKGNYNMNLDNNKTMRNDFIRNSGMIVIKSLEKLLDQKFRIPVSQYNHFEITLNIPHDWIYKMTSDWHHLGDFQMLKSPNGFVSIPKDSKTEKVVFIKTE